MYQSLEELCQLEEQENKPFWKIVQEDDCREQGISEQENFERILRFQPLKQYLKEQIVLITEFPLLHSLLLLNLFPNL